MPTRDLVPLMQWGAGSDVHSVAISHDGTYIASGALDGHVRIWKMCNGGLFLGPLKQHTGAVRSVDWSHDDSRIVSGSGDGTVCIWDALIGTPTGALLRGHTKAVFRALFSSDSTRIISGSYDNTIHIWDASSGTSINQLHMGWVWSIALSPDSTRIVSGMFNGAISFWDTSTGTPVGEPLNERTARVNSLEFSPDSTRVVSGSGDHTICIRDVRTGALVAEPLRGHTDSICSVKFSSDGAYVVSGSDDKTVRIWDAHTGDPIGDPLRGHTNSVASVVCSPDGTCIISGSSDATICIWEALQTTPSFTKDNAPSFDAVTSKMSVQELFECLVRHGCADLTSLLDVTQSSEVVASGGFGDVRRMVMHDDTSVAIKTLRLQILLKGNDKAMKRAVREVYVWSKVRHANIQRLLGIAIFQGGLGMVSPWMGEGNLQQYIATHPDVERYQLCVQVASGVSYLHSVGVVHGDLKATNVLVSSDGTLKINDFDHAILACTTLRFSTTSRPGGGTLRWMAPELLQSDEENGEEDTQAPPARSKQTDIYALGMTMLEILTGNVPYYEYQNDMSIYRAVDKQQPPRRPKMLRASDKAAEHMWALFLNCWDHDRFARPNAESVLASLNSILSG